MDDIDLVGEVVKVVLGERGYTLHVISPLYQDTQTGKFFHLKDGILILYRNGNWLVHLGYKDARVKKKFNNIFESFEEVLKFLDEVENGRP